MQFVSSPVGTPPGELRVKKRELMQFSKHNYNTFDASAAFLVLFLALLQY
jgi:hypothetical protein